MAERTSRPQPALDPDDALARVAERRSALVSAREVVRGAAAALEDAVIAAADAGAPQRTIAETAGISQPYVSKLTARRRRFHPTSKLGQVLADRREDVLRVVRSYGADNIVVFGSVATGTDSADSDIDLMIDIPDDMGLFTLGRLEQDVRDLLGVDVDVIPSRLAKPHIRRSAAKNAAPL